jgi:phosphatidylglycerol:prolipoprotein diacylglycerol transferase
MIIDVSNINPVAFSIGFVKIHWYGLAYAVGILLGFKFSMMMAKKFNKSITAKQIDDFFIWVIFGIIFGGRFFYVLFYQPKYYFSNPIEILYIMNGGMSFHGGLIGVGIAMYLYCRKHKINLLSFMDTIAVSAPIGLFLGRIANFVNGELWGVPTDGSWGFIFADGILRHPSQLYEAFLEGLILFLILNIMAVYYNAFKYKGLLVGTFTMMYGIFRIFIEGFREPDSFIGYLSHSTTMGQWLSVPMLILGASLIRTSVRGLK